MKKETLIIDNTGFDVSVMSQLKENEFVEIHKDTDVICRGKSEAERLAWLKDAYRAIKGKAKEQVKKSDAPAIKVEET